MRPRAGETARTSVRHRLLLLGLSVPLLAASLLVVEAGLAVTGAGADPGGDPFVGFEPGHPLFVRRADPGGPDVFTTAESKLRFFNRQSFPVSKPPGGLRVFTLGGSTTYGRPYDHQVSFSRWLQLLLDETDPTRPHEVVNAGGVSYASYRIVVLMQELVRYQPDLFVIYTGHNEFLEERSYADVVHLSPPLRALRTRLDRLRSVRLLRVALDRLAHRPSGPADRLPAEVEARLDVREGLQAFARDDALKAAILEHFRHNVAQMVRIARDHGVELLFVAPASNLKDFSPFKSQHHPALSAASLDGFERLRREATSFASQGRWREALGRFEEAARLSPEHAENHFQIGRCHLQLEDFERAAQHLGLARQLDVCPLRAPDEIGAALAGVSAESGAPLLDFDALLRRDSRARYGHELLGDEYFLDHVHPQVAVHQRLAEWILEALAERGLVPRGAPLPAERRQALYAAHLASLPGSYYAQRDRNLGKVLGWAGKYQESAAALRRAADQLPADPMIRHDLGLALLELGRHPEAVEQLEEATRLAPRLVGAHFNLGKALQAAGAFGPASRSFEQVLSLEPGHARALYNLARCFHELGLAERELAALERARAADPELPEIDRLLGSAYERSGRLDQALELYQQALRRHPSAAAHSDLAGVLRLRQDLDAASRSASRALELDPDFADAHRQLGWIHRARGEREAARTAFQRVAERLPADASAQLELGRSHQELKDWEAAAAAYRRAILLDPTLAPAHIQLGVVYGQQDRLEQAALAFERGLELDPEAGVAHYHLASLYAAAGRSALAARHFRRAHELGIAVPAALLQDTR